MMIAGAAPWLSRSALAAFWSSLAAAAALASISGGKRLSILLRWQAAAFVGAAAVASGFAGVVARAFWGDPGRSRGLPGAPVLAVLGSAIAVFSVLAAVRRSGSRFSDFLPALLAAAIALAGGSAILVLVVVPAARMDAGSLAALRTGALAAASFAAALLGRFGRAPEAGWLVYPLLGLGGVKLLLEDVPRGRPLTLFVGFAIFGAALLAAPRIARVRAEGRRARRVMSAVRRLDLTGDQALGRADGDRVPGSERYGFPGSRIVSRAERSFLSGWSRTCSLYIWLSHRACLKIRE